MASGSQGQATGLALRFAEYVRMELVRRGMSIDALAKISGMSTNYLATRLRGERVLNLRDFEAIGNAFEIDPQEMLARVQFEPARSYRGRLVPLYGVTVSQADGMEIFRTEDAVPPVRDLTMRINGKPIDDHSEEDDYALPEGVVVGGFGQDGEPEEEELEIPENVEEEWGLAAHPKTELPQDHTP